MGLPVLIFLLPFLSFSQQTYPDSLFRKTKVVVSNFEAPKTLARMVSRQFEGVNSNKQFKERVQKVEAAMAAEGYAEFTLDSFKIEGKELELWFYTGSRYFLDSVALGNVNESAVIKAGLDFDQAKVRPLDRAGLETSLQACLDWYQDRGYPFARFDSLRMGFDSHGDSILARVGYSFDPGNFIQIDTVIFDGDVREKPYFMRALIGLQPGDMFDQSTLDGIPKALNNTIYFQQAKVKKVTFSEENKATVTVGVERRKAGKFDILVGILPPRDNTAKLQFTGLADIQLVSPIFKAGEILQFRFDKLVGSSQKLHLNYMHPYLFATPVRLQMDFDLLKQDTTFLTRYFKFSGYYAFSQTLSVKAWTRTRTSTLISTTRWENDSLARPPVLDAKDRTFGLGLLFENVDYKFNPTRGWIIRADFGLGRKRIVENPRLHDNLYKDLLMELPRREAEFELWWYHRFSKRWVIALGERAYWLDQKQYFQNDLLQVGGSRSIRGFNENEFFTNFYSLSTAELRFLLERNSYLFVFGDYAYLENATATRKVVHPTGFGLGMTYETKAGMVSLTYAAGRVEGQTFAPSRGRIHVGLINQF